MLPKQQGNNAAGRKVPQRPHFSCRVKKNPDLEEVGRQHCPVLSQSRARSLSQHSHRKALWLSVGRCFWLEYLNDIGTLALPIAPSVYSQKHLAVPLTGVR